MTPTNLKRLATALEAMGEAWLGIAATLDLIAEDAGAEKRDISGHENGGNAGVEVERCDIPASVALVASQSPLPKSPSKRLNQKTPERVALLRKLWGAPGISRQEILDQLNALPGAPIPAHYLVIYVLTWGVAETARGGTPSKVTTPPPKVATPPSLPPPPPEPLAPVVDFSAFSVAGRIDADNLASQADCPITWPDALEWATRHRPNGFNIPVTKADVNAIRDAHGLPRYRIVAARGPIERLPASHLDTREMTSGVAR